MENEQDPNARPNADDAFRDEPLSTESEGGGGDHAAPAGGLDEPTLMPGAMGPESDSSGTPFGDALPPSGDTSVADDPDGPTLKPTNLNHGNLVNEDSPIVAPTVDAPAAQPCNQSLPREFGDYELIEEIARGGMGVVFRARQQRLNRVVAIKMILTGQLAREEDIARFYTEAEAAASLDHQGIVPIYEVGCHEGQHFFSMGYVEGPSLTQMILERPAEASVAAELCRQVAVAVGYAHGRGVIHRDLKPANVLVARDESSNRDGELAPSAASVASLMGWSSNASPVSCGVAKVTDFGLAKNVEQQSELTATGQILGTPGYMPPEQAAGRIDEVDAVADVYSIGGILYALLTGRAPFQAATPLDTLMQVLEREPVAPRQLNANVPADLETICLKCLQKDPKRRYGSAAELADDLTRFLQGDPIEARPVTRIERAWRWARRHPAVAALGTTTAILIGVIATIAPLIAVRQSQLRVAEQSLRIEAVQLSEDLADAKDDTEANLYAARVKLAFQNFLDGSLPQMRKTLNEAPTAYRSWEWDFVSGLNGAGRLVLRGHPGEVLQVRFVPNEDESKPPQLLTIGSRMNARLWDLETGAPGRRVELATKTAMMDGDGKRSLGFVDDAAVVINHGQTVYPVLRFVVDGAPIVAVTMSADSRRGAVLRRTAIDEFSLHVHDTIDGSTIAGPWVLDPVSEPKLVFSQDGGRLALADFDPASKDSTRVHVWIDSAKEGWSVATLDTEATPTAIAWADRASTSKRLLVGDGRGYVRVHEVSDDEGTPIERTARVESEEAAVIGKPMMTLSGSGAGIMSLAYDPQSKRLAAACEDRQVVVWDDFASTTRSVLCGLEDRPTELSISSGGRFLASGSGFGAAVWKLPPEDALPLRQEAEPVALSPRPLGDIAIASSGDAFVLDRAGRVRRVNAATGDVSDSEMQRWLSGQQTFPGRKPPQRDPTIPGKLAISSDGRLMALSVSRFDQDPSTSKRRIRSSVVLWDLRARRPAGVLGEQNNVITGLAFSPSGDRLVTVTGIPDATKRAIERDDRMGNSIQIPDNDVRVWDVNSGQVILAGLERASHFTAVHWLEDSSRLMVASKDGNLESIDAADLSLVAEILLPVSLRADDIVEVPDELAARPLLEAEKSKVRMMLAVGFSDGQIRLYDADTGKLRRSLIGHAGEVQALHYDHARRRLFSGGKDSTLRVWEPQRGLEVLVLPNDGSPIADVRLSEDGRLLATGEDGSLRQWKVGRILTAGPGETERWKSLSQLEKTEAAPDDATTNEPSEDALAVDTPAVDTPAWYRPESWITQMGDWTIEPGRLTATTAPAGATRGSFKLGVARAQLASLILPDTLELSMRVRLESGAGLQIQFREPGGQEAEVVELLSDLNPFSQRQGVRVYAMSDFITARETTANSSAILTSGQFHDVRLWRLPRELIVSVDGRLALVSPQPTVFEANLILQPMYGEIGAQVTVEDLEIRSPTDAIRRVQVASEVSQMLEKWKLTDWVERKISAYGDWSIELKRYARQHLGGLSEDSQLIGKTLEAFVTRFHQPTPPETADETNKLPDDPRWILDLARWQVDHRATFENQRILADVLYANDNANEAADVLRASVVDEKARQGAVSIESLWSLALMESKAGRKDIAMSAARRALKLEVLEPADRDPESSGLSSRHRFYRNAAFENLPELGPGKEMSLEPDPILQASLATWLDIQRGAASERLDEIVDDSFTATWKVNGDKQGGYTSPLETYRKRLRFARQDGAAVIEDSILVDDYEVATRGDLGAVRATIADQTSQGYRRCRWTFRLKRTDSGWRLLSVEDLLLSQGEFEVRTDWDESLVNLRREDLESKDDSIAVMRQKMKAAKDLRDIDEAEEAIERLIETTGGIADDWVSRCIVKMRLGKIEEARKSAEKALAMNASVAGPPLLKAIRDASSDGSGDRQSIGAGLSAAIPDGWRRAGREVFLAPGDFLSGWFLPGGTTAMLAMRVPQALTADVIKEQMKQFDEGENRSILQVVDREVGDLDAVAVRMEGAGNGGMIDGRGEILTHQFNLFIFREKDVIILTVVCPADKWQEIEGEITTVTDSLRYDPSEN